MKKLFLLLISSLAVAGFAEEELLQKLVSETPQVVSKMVSNKESSTIYTLPLPLEDERRAESQEETEAIIPSLLQKESTPSSAKRSFKLHYFETYAVFISYSNGYAYHVADYYDGTRVITCLNGSLPLLQMILVSGMVVAESSVVEYHDNYLVHYYTGGKIYSDEKRQVIEIH